MDLVECKSIVFSSSATVYGDPSYLPYDENHPTNPIGVYGMSKAAAEESILNAKIDAWIVRTSWLFSPFGKNFVKTIINVSTSGTNNVVITPANLRGYSTITLNAQGETVTCLFKNSKWNVIAGNGYVLA